MLGVRQQHVMIAVSGLLPGAGSWLSEVLSPYVDVSTDPDPREAHARVEVVDVLPVEARRESSGWPVTEGVHAGLCVDTGTVFVRADPARESHRVALVQTVRGILADRILRTTGSLHAAVVRVAGRGLLLAGPKGAGKTSFTSAVLRAAEGSELVTNDKGFLLDDAVHGLPFAVLVGEEGLRRTPELSAVPHRPAGEKVAVWPRDFAAAFGRRVSTSTTADIGIWCDARFDNDHLAITRLDLGALGDRVDSALAAFSPAMLPLHLVDDLHRDMPARAAAARSSWRSLTWYHARGNPWSLGRDHLSLLHPSRQREVVA